MIKQFFNSVVDLHKEFFSTLQGRIEMITTKTTEKRTKDHDERMTAFSQRESEENPEKVKQDREKYKIQFEEETKQITAKLEKNKQVPKDSLQKAMEIVYQDTGLMPQVAMYETAVYQAARTANLLQLEEIKNGQQVACNGQFQAMIQNRGSEPFEIRAKRVNWTTTIVFAILTAIAGILLKFVPFSPGWDIFMYVVLGIVILVTLIAGIVTLVKVPKYIPETQKYTHANLLDIAFLGVDQKAGITNIIFPCLSDHGKEVIATMTTKGKKVLVLCEENTVRFNTNVIKSSELQSDQLLKDASQPIFYTVVLSQEFEYASNANLPTKENIIVFLYGYPDVENLVQYEIENLSGSLTDESSKQLLDVIIKCDKQFTATHTEKLHQAYKGTDDVRKAYLDVAYLFLRNMSYLKGTNTVLSIAANSEYGNENKEVTMYDSMKTGLIAHTKVQLTELTKIVANYVYTDEQDMDAIVNSFINLKSTVRYQPQHDVIEKGAVVI